MAKQSQYDREQTDSSKEVVKQEAKQQASAVSDKAQAKASKVADKAQSEARQVAEGAKQQFSDVAADAQKSASAVASEAKSETQKVVDEATNQASALMDDVQKQASAFFSENIEGLTTQISGFASALRQTGQNLREQDEGAQFAGYAETIADQLESLTQGVQSGNINQLLSEAEEFARREPAIFMGGALAAGLAIARFLKSSSPASASGSRYSSSYAQGRISYPSTGSYGSGTSGSSYRSGSSYGSGASDSSYRSGSQDGDLWPVDDQADYEGNSPYDASTSEGYSRSVADEGLRDSDSISYGESGTDGVASAIEDAGYQESTGGMTARTDYGVDGEEL